MRLGSALVALRLLAYPALVYVGMSVLEPRALGVLLLIVLLLRHRRAAGQLLRDMPTGERAVLTSLLLLSLAIIAANSEFLLRLYPATISFGMLALFAMSLWRPPSMVERFARLHEPDLPPAGVRYTRRVTQVWCVFLVCNGSIALASVFASREIWALWNGLLSYVAMGTLFAGEWLFRRHVRRQTGWRQPAV